MATRLQRLDDLDLVLRRHARKHRGLFDVARQLGHVDAVQFGAGQHRTVQAQLAGNGRCSEGMVAGDHLDLDAGLLAQLDRVARFRARRVDEADESGQAELPRPRHRIGSGIEVAQRDVSVCNGQHAHGLAGETGVLGLECGAGRLVQRRIAGCAQKVAGTRQQHIGRALHVHAHPLTITVKSGHEFVCRVERNFSDSRAARCRAGGTNLTFALTLATALGGQRQQCAFGRVTDQLAVADAAFIAQRGRDQQGLEIRQRQTVWRADGAFAGVAFPGNDEVSTSIEQLARGHLVQREGAGLVGADHCGRAERFHRREFLHDRTVLRHAVHADGQCHRHHRRQALGNGRHGQSDRGHDGLRQRVPTQHPQAEDQRHHGAGRSRQAFAQRVDLHLQRRALFRRRFEQAADAPHLGLHAGGNHHCLDATPRDHRVHEHHVEALGQRIRPRRKSRSELADRMRFAGQGRLGHLGAVGSQHAGVGRHAVARFEQDDVARHQRLRIHLQDFATAPHTRMARQHLFERSQRRLGAMLLVEAKAGVEHDDHQNDHRILGVADGTCQQRGADQHQHQQVLELVGELEPDRTRRFLEKLVRTKALEPLSRVVGSQAVGRRLQLGQNRRRVHGPGFCELGHGKEAPSRVPFIACFTLFHTRRHQWSMRASFCDFILRNAVPTKMVRREGQPRAGWTDRAKPPREDHHRCAV